MNNVSYSNPVPPAEYKCKGCGATGVKLWREYETFQPKLLCAKCAAKDQHKSIADIDAAGKRTDALGARTDQIGWYVPAVPDEEGIGYWGYTSVPQAGVEWWKALPTLNIFIPKEKRPCAASLYIRWRKFLTKSVSKFRYYWQGSR